MRPVTRGRRILALAAALGALTCLAPAGARAGQWRLLTPPVAAKPGAPAEATAHSGLPLRQWVLHESYQSATECERGKSRNLLTETEILIETKGRPDEGLAAARVSAASLGRCVAAEDVPLR